MVFRENAVDISLASTKVYFQGKHEYQARQEGENEETAKS